MTEEAQRKLQPTYEKVIEHLLAISGADSYEEAIARLRRECQDKNRSPAPWLHKLAREMYQRDEPDSVRPEFFYEILGMIDTREKATAIFAAFPDEDVPKIEHFLSFVLKELLPDWRSNAERMVGILPYHRGGGRPPTMPSEEECRSICHEVERLKRDGVKTGFAQQRIADRTGLSLRTVQRICAKYKSDG
ncbi:MAG TPA: hypothetical protein VFA99_16965 [Acidobacteriaceae bacterium]|nr:hypothetical protein [Acidobacteriaceae bacterium]